MLTNVSKKEKFAKELLYYAAYDRICVKYFLSYEYSICVISDSMCSTNALSNVCTKYNIHRICFPTLCQLINRFHFQKTCYAKFVLRDALFIHMTSLIISYDITEETIYSICVFRGYCYAF